MIETINYIIGFIAIGLFLYFMWIDTKPLHKHEK
jgi:hypothetical protein